MVYLSVSGSGYPIRWQASWYSHPNSNGAGESASRPSHVLAGRPVPCLLLARSHSTLMAWQLALPRVSDLTASGRQRAPTRKTVVYNRILEVTSLSTICNCLPRQPGCSMR